VNVSKDKLVLDGENLILIYEYILAKCALRDLHAHIQLCFEFSTPFLKTTKYGYCLTTMQMAMTMLTEKSELIDVRVIEDDFSDEEEETWRAKHRSISQSVAEIFNQREDRTFSLGVPDNILSNVLDSAVKRR
jgi:hypothetical protein